MRNLLLWLVLAAALLVLYMLLFVACAPLKMEHYDLVHYSPKVLFFGLFVASLIGALKAYRRYCYMKQVIR